MLNRLPIEKFDPMSPLMSSVFPSITHALLTKPSTVDTGFSVIPANESMSLGVSIHDPKLPFGWDNEFPIQTVAVNAFAIRNTPITNGEWLAFLSSGGYTTKELWSEEDWNWVTSQDIKAPIHWISRDNAWLLRVIFCEIPLPLDWPVHVSQAEAKAWCKWKSINGEIYRLPTEAEWVHAAYSEQNGSGFYYRQFPWGDQEPSADHANFDMHKLVPSGVMDYAKGRNYYGLWDMMGNGWEWTATPFHGFDGFEPIIPTYANYSTDFFDGKHFVLRGGSYASARQQLRSSFRNWYQGHYPYVFSKFRPVQVLPPTTNLTPTNGQAHKAHIVKLEVAASPQSLMREFADNVISGLEETPPRVSSMFLYNAEGSKIYEEITELEEYYPTRTEHALLKSQVAQISDEIDHVGDDKGKSTWMKFNLVEFGAGDGHKTQVLIDHFHSVGKEFDYYPIDISEEALIGLMERVKSPTIIPITANNPIGLSYVVSHSLSPTLALFLGSSIGNFDPIDANRFLSTVSSKLRPGDFFLIGFDLKKDITKIKRAYDDSQGVTAKFNYNLLKRMNDELGANFDLAKWRHFAEWNPNIGAMESWLVPTDGQTITFGPQAQNSSFTFNAWEGILIERSYKYSLEQIHSMCRDAGFNFVKDFVHEGFCDSLWRA